MDICLCVQFWSRIEILKPHLGEFEAIGQSVYLIKLYLSKLEANTELFDEDLRLVHPLVVKTFLNADKKIEYIDSKIEKQKQISEKRRLAGSIGGNKSKKKRRVGQNKANAKQMLSKCLANAKQMLDFESIYKIYPRKEGKKRGLEICQRDIKTIEDYNLLRSAVERYNKKLLRDQTDPKFIKQFSTFMSSWRDWIDEDAGTVVTKKPIFDYSKGQFEYV